MDLIKRAQQLLEIEASAILNASKSLDESFVKAHKLLKNAVDKKQKIIFIGMGKSHYVAAKLAASFLSAGFSSVFIHPAEAVHGDLGAIACEDVCILISKSGGTAEILGLLPFFKKRNPIIALVGNLESPIAKHSDVCLNASVEQEACPINMLPTASTTVALALGDALLSVLAEQEGFSKEKFAGFHPGGSIGKRLHQHVKDVMLSIEDFPFGNSQESLESIAQKMNEKPVGAFCIVDAQMKLQGIIVEGDMRRATAKKLASHTPASEIMTHQPIVLKADLLIDEALSIMEHKDKRITCAPVVGKNFQLLGFVQIHDLL